MLDYGLDLSAVERDVALPDLVTEGDELDALVSAQSDWSKPTPAAGWTIANQIAHLASADANVLIAIRTPDAFDTVLKQAEAGQPLRRSRRRRESSPTAIGTAGTVARRPNRGGSGAR